MDLQVKLIFTIAVALAAVGVILIDRTANNAGPDSFWRFGKHDPVRNLLCQADGTLRPHTKRGLLLVFVAFLAILWLVPVVG